VGTSLNRRVADYCRRHRLLVAGAPVLALVSGGADSVCLVHVLREIHDGPLVVLSIDHGLRPEAAEEVAAVEALARPLGAAFVGRALHLEDGPDLQERARDARLAAAREVADAHGCARIATGHTASDQAETVLFRLARGTGRSGALGIAPRRGRLVRPLLCLTRAETRQWCVDAGVGFTDDPSNLDPRFTRARLRHGLLDALAEVHPGAERNVAAFADRLRDEDALLDGLVADAWARCAGPRGLRVDALGREAPPLQRLLLRRLIADAGLPGGAREARHVERIAALLERPARIELPGGSASVAEGQLVVRRRVGEAAA
jgi:tRNA(Ile)-lysidine synthase